MIIRQATLEDLDRIVALERESFPDEAWPRSVFQEDLARPASLYLLAADRDGRGIGYIACGLSPDQGFCHISSLAVAPSHRRRGIGSKLLDAFLVSTAKQGVRIWRAETRRSNAASRNLFQSRGFRETTLLRGYYNQPEEDGILLIKME